MRRTVPILAAALLTLVACASSTDDTVQVDTDAAVRGASATLEQQGTARMEMRTEITTAMGTEAFTMVMDVDFDTDDSIVTMQGPAFDQGFEARNVGDTAYYRLPSGGWLEVELDADLVDQFAEIGGSDPLAQLELLTTAGSIEEVGTDEINGVATTVHRADFDIAEALEVFGFPPELRGQLDEVDLDTDLRVHLDDDGLLRRLTIDLQMALHGDTISMSVVQDVVETGIDLAVQAPPAAEIARTERISSLFELQTLLTEVL